MTVDFARYITSAPLRASEIVKEWKFSREGKKRAPKPFTQPTYTVEDTGMKTAEFGPLEEWVETLNTGRKQDPTILVLGGSATDAQTFRELAGGYIAGTDKGEGECYVIEPSTERIEQALATLRVPNITQILDKIINKTEPTWDETKPSPFYTFINGDPAELEGIGERRFDYIFIHDVPQEKLASTAIRAIRKLNVRGALIQITTDDARMVEVESALHNYRVRTEIHHDKCLLMAYHANFL
jgi:hypothetical protein